MDIVVKIDPSKLAGARDALLRHASQVATGAGEGVAVEPVFPEVTKGRRAGLFTLKVPAAVTAAEVARLMSGLREDAEIEYAEPAAEKRPIDRSDR